MELILRNKNTNKICTLKLDDDFVESLEEMVIHYEYHTYELTRIQTEADKINLLVEKFGQKYAYEIANKHTNTTNNSVDPNDILQEEVESLLKSDDEFKELVDHPQYDYIVQSLTRCVVSTCQGIIGYTKIVEKDLEIKQHESIFIDYLRRYMDLLKTDPKDLPFSSMMEQLMELAQFGMFHDEIKLLQFHIKNAMKELLNKTPKDEISDEEDRHLRQQTLKALIVVSNYSQQVYDNAKKATGKNTHVVYLNTFKDIFIELYNYVKSTILNDDESQKKYQDIMTYIRKASLPQLRDVVMYSCLDYNDVPEQSNYRILLTKYSELALYIEELAERNNIYALVNISKILHPHAEIIQKLLNKTFTVKDLLEGKYNDELTKLTNELNRKV